MFDCNSKEVLLGSRVRILSVDSVLIQSLEKEERELAISFIDQIFVVDKIDNNYVVFSKQKMFPDGRTISQSLSFSASEIVLVNN